MSSPIHDIASSDLYQLYAYGKLYECRAVALVYPRSGTFTSPFTARFFDGPEARLRAVRRCVPSKLPE